MPMTTTNLVKQVRERLQQIDAELERLQAERAELKAAVSGEVSKPSRGTRKPGKRARKGKTSSASKAIAKAGREVWADVHRLHKAGKISAPSRKARAEYYKKQEKSKTKPRAKAKKTAPASEGGQQ